MCSFGFGVSKQVKNNVHHIDDRHILQPLGKHVANYDCSTSEVNRRTATVFLSTNSDYCDQEIYQISCSSLFLCLADIVSSGERGRGKNMVH